MKMVSDLQEEGAIFVGPENVFVGPSGRGVSCANSKRIEIL